MFEIISAPIDLAALAHAVRSDACGGVVTFCGIVRERSDDGRLVTGLSYEAHEAMAVAEFERIASEARKRFGAHEIAIAHRVGDLTIGEVAVAVVVASAHRGAAFDACEYVIDELKRRAPIWKKEHYADGGDSVWKQNDCRRTSQSEAGTPNV
ncbi:MAG TPA: molybdenum cofactor biosynthesis protein MoaE [Candidatus Baltobacteraceae bacterium]|nr:molybdenum cofactor biosynthesis protein MoaE [Candidatus Baltobacteraceae bacterium]